MKYLIYIVVLFFSFTGFSQITKNEISIEQRLNTFFEFYKNDVELAVGSIIFTEGMVTKTDETAMKIITSELKLLKDLKKKYYGYEISTKNYIGNSYSKITCLVKHEVPYFIIFEMYKPNKNWIVREINIRKNYRKLFPY